MTDTVTEPGVIPVAGVTLSQLALGETEKLRAALLSMRTVCAGGAAAPGAWLNESDEGAAVTAAPVMVSVTGMVTGEVPPLMVTAA